MKANKQGKVNYASCAGSSLNVQKAGLRAKKLIDANTISMASLFEVLEQDYDVRHIDILKLDVEGHEYCILHHLLDEGLLARVGKLFYEDHTRKISDKSYRLSKEAFFERICDTDLVNKIYVEDSERVYKPICEVFNGQV